MNRVRSIFTVGAVSTGLLLGGIGVNNIAEASPYARYVPQNGTTLAKKTCRQVPSKTQKSRNKKCKKIRGFNLDGLGFPYRK